MWIYFPDNIPLEFSQAHHSRHMERQEEAQTLSAATNPTLPANGIGDQDHPSASPHSQNTNPTSREGAD